LRPARQPHLHRSHNRERDRGIRQYDETIIDVYETIIDVLGLEEQQGRRALSRARRTRRAVELADQGTDACPLCGKTGFLMRGLNELKSHMSYTCARRPLD